MTKITKFRIASIALLILTLPACPSTPSLPSQNTPQPVPSSTTYKPNLATVEASFDTARTAEDVVVMPEGLTLEVTGEDGTRYTYH